MAMEEVSEGFISDVLESYNPPGNPLKPKEVEWIRNTDGSVLLDHNNRPISVAKLLATRPLRQELCSRPGPGNKKLTYLSGEGVTRTLNEVFGFDGWNLEIKQTTREECIKDEKGRYHVAYTATVRLTHRQSGAYKEDCGAGDSIDRSMGTAIAHSLKASITDAMKRAARHFGDKLGNSLYQGSFTINKAPLSLKQALDQYDINRANTKFGVQKNQMQPVATDTAVKTESPPPVKPSAAQNVKVRPTKSSPPPPVPAKKAVSNTYHKKSMAPPIAQTSQDSTGSSSALIGRRLSAPMPTKPAQYPVQTPKGAASAVSTVTPSSSNPPPTPGQRLQSFGLGQYVAGKGKLSYESESENQPPQNNGAESKRPGTSTGLQQQEPRSSGVGPFAGRRPSGNVNKRPLEPVANHHMPHKKANTAQQVPAQRNPYV